MLIYIDIDDTIAIMGGDRNYSNAKPNYDNIKKANKLYDDGNTIIYWTARGTVSGIDWKEITKKQLSDWGVKYHNLKFDKPPFDMFIDDKAINSKDW